MAARWPDAATPGSAESTAIVPPMLSPPLLTGVIPAITFTLPTLPGSIYDKGGFMWLLQCGAMDIPLTTTFTRSSNSPWMAGRLDKPPLAARLSPGTSAKSEAVSLVPVFLFRSEEHTSELQSLRHLVCRLL